MKSKNRKLGHEKEQEIREALNRSDTGIHIEAPAAPLTGLMLTLQSLLVLYQQYAQGTALFSLATPGMKEAIEFALSETVSLMMSIFEEQKTLTSGCKALSLTTLFEVPVDPEDITRMEAELEMF